MLYPAFSPIESFLLVDRIQFFGLLLRGTSGFLVFKVRTTFGTISSGAISLLLLLNFEFFLGFFFFSLFLLSLLFFIDVVEVLYVDLFGLFFALFELVVDELVAELIFVLNISVGVFLLILGKLRVKLGRSDDLALAHILLLSTIGELSEIFDLVELLTSLFFRDFSFLLLFKLF